MLKLSLSLEMVLLGISSGVGILAPQYDMRNARKKVLKYDTISVNRFASRYYGIMLTVSVSGRLSVHPSVVGVVGWCEGVVYLTSPGRPTDIGLQSGKACYPCSR